MVSNDLREWWYSEGPITLWYNREVYLSDEMEKLVTYFFGWFEMSFPILTHNFTLVVYFHFLGVDLVHFA